jgi:integrase
VLEKIERVDENPWVIVGTLPAARLSDLQPFWQRVRARAGLKDVRIHDLRHTFASTAIAQGQGLSMIGNFWAIRSYKRLRDTLTSRPIQ